MSKKHSATRQESNKLLVLKLEQPRLPPPHPLDYGRKFRKTMGTEKKKSRILNLIPPQNPKSAYVHYTESKFYQSKLQKQNWKYSLNLTRGELWDYGREVWDKMREEDKIRFFENEKKDRDRYERELLIYNNDKAIAEKKDSTKSQKI